jgi:hypothetical protein
MKVTKFMFNKKLWVAADFLRNKDHNAFHALIHCYAPIMFPCCKATSAANAATKAARKLIVAYALQLHTLEGQAEGTLHSKLAGIYGRPEIPACCLSELLAAVQYDLRDKWKDYAKRQDPVRAFALYLASQQPQHNLLPTVAKVIDDFAAAGMHDDTNQGIIAAKKRVCSRDPDLKHLIEVRGFCRVQVDVL